MDGTIEISRKLRGTKRVCKECDGKFYDLGRDPTVCPMCQTSSPVSSFLRPETPRAAYSGSWSRNAGARKVLHIEDAAPKTDEDVPALEATDDTTDDAPAAHSDEVLEPDADESDVSDLLSPDDAASPDD